MMKPALWVSYRAHLDNGMIISNDGFYEGQLPVTMPMLIRVRGEIRTMVEEHMANIKQVDKKGAAIIGAPKPKIMMIEICALQPGEIDDGNKLN